MNMLIMDTRPPSLRLRDSLNGLMNWARQAPPPVDECDWSPATYAERIRSQLYQIDEDFAALHTALRKAQESLKEARE